MARRGVVRRGWAGKEDVMKIIIKESSTMVYCDGRLEDRQTVIAEVKK